MNSKLTTSEINVLKCAAKGLSSKEIAARLIISKRTVDFHLGNAYRKMHSHNRIQAIRSAVEMGYLLGGFEPK